MSNTLPHFLAMRTYIFHSKSHFLFFFLVETDGPSSKYGTPSPEILLRPLMLHLGDRDERQGTKLLSEIRGMFENMTRMFADMKNVGP